MMIQAPAGHRCADFRRSAAMPVAPTHHGATENGRSIGTIDQRGEEFRTLPAR
jgi:hypothetical protein